MSAITAKVVSKRGPMAALTLTLLMAAGLVSLSDCHEQPLPMGAYSVAP